MDLSPRGKWIPVAFLVAIIYIVTGVVTASLAAQASSHDWVVKWRLVAWVISALAFMAQIGYDQIRFLSAPRLAALHAALAAAVGAFGLAVAALIHRHGVAGPTGYLSFLVWPVVVFIPAFPVAWMCAFVFDKRDQRQ